MTSILKRQVNMRENEIMELQYQEKIFYGVKNNGVRNSE